MKLELKNIKHSASLSEETNAYTARVYKDGKPFCDVSNHGTGGCDSQHPIAPFTYADIKAADEWCGANLPPLDMSKYGMEPLRQTFEGWCHAQLEDHLVASDLRRLMKGKVLYLHDGKVYTSGFKGIRTLTPRHLEVAIASLKKTKPDAKVLNCLPFGEALAIFRQAA